MAGPVYTPGVVTPAQVRRKQQPRPALAQPGQSENGSARRSRRRVRLGRVGWSRRASPCCPTHAPRTSPPPPPLQPRPLFQAAPAGNWVAWKRSFTEQGLRGVVRCGTGRGAASKGLFRWRVLATPWRVARAVRQSPAGVPRRAPTCPRVSRLSVSRGLCLPLWTIGKGGGGGDRPDSSCCFCPQSGNDPQHDPLSDKCI